MEKVRKINKVYRSRPTIEGAGVRLRRAFGYYNVPMFDPFLLLDDFRSNNPDDYVAGFPWHPHRGIETITYMLHGKIEHGDSLGNGGIIGAGDVQWMTAGSGIIHQEMPQKVAGDPKMDGFQLWANLPASHKMMNPRYRDIKSEQIPNVELENGIVAKVVCGEVNGTSGPVTDIITEPEYLDVSIPANQVFTHKIKDGKNAFAYVIEGEGYFDGTDGDLIDSENLVHFRNGDMVQLKAGTKNLRLLLVSGKPLYEPVAWRGPIVMNTNKELALAFQEYQTGNFIKYKP